jgi:hypothetical protein
LTIKGIVRIVKMLFTAVSEMDNATLPLNRYVTNPDVVPPGQAARIIIPTLKASGRLEKERIINAIIGNAIICDPRPIKNALGANTILLKFVSVTDKPNPNMMEARTKPIRISMSEYEIISIKHECFEPVHQTHLFQEW